MILLMKFVFSVYYYVESRREARNHDKTKTSSFDNMVFQKQEHKNIIKELGFNPEHDYQEDDELTTDLFMAVTDRFQKQGFTYVDKEPIPTHDGLLCEEIADILAEL